MSKLPPKVADNHKNQTSPEQKNNEKQHLIPTNDFQKFFKLEFDSLNNYVFQEMENLKEDFESEILVSKSLLKKYENLRRLCDKKLELDEFRYWSDHHNLKTSHKTNIYDDPRDKYYISHQSRSRQMSPTYSERRFNSRMTRQLPSSQRQRSTKRTYQDDLKRASRYKIEKKYSSEK